MMSPFKKSLEANPMRRITFGDRVRYRFDTLMSKGTIAQIALLGLITLIFIVGTAAVVAITGIANADDNAGPDFFRLVWMGLMRTLDAGTMGGDEGAPPFLGAMLLITLGGVFVVSTLIGILTNGVEAKIDELRKGRSFVVEENHTLILGWSPQVFTLISEIVEANANKKNQCLVILADKDKVEMEDEIRAKVPNTKTTRIVCRTGNPLDLTDLEIANPHAARSILIVGPKVDEPDTYVIKTMLALTNNPNRKSGKYHIVAEIQQPKNFAVARMVGRDEAQVVLIGDLISRITVQTCRQSGLSVVYTELLNFGGDEIYFKTEPALAGKTFGEALLAYADSTVIGLRTKDGVHVNPPMDTRIAAGDQIIAIAADDDRIQLAGVAQFGIDESAMQTKRSGAPAPEQTLILGWNQRASAILRELDSYVAPGSRTTVVANIADFEKRTAQTQHQSVTFQAADTTDRQVLEALTVTTFDHIIVLSYSDDLDTQRADAQTLITLLHLRDMSERAQKEFSIVSEMLDVRNRELAEVTRADDFIVSDQLVSLLMAQVSENAELNAVFADLFDPEGSEIYLKPASDYVRLDTPVNFYTVVEAARRRGEVAMGYRLKSAAHDHEKTYGVVLNPVKSNSITFAQGDKLIVLAEG
jgi:voltage-gated potassium channel Kch